MAESIVYNSQNIYQPGVYSQTLVDVNGGFAPSTRGIVGIIGEATSGAPGSSDGVMTYTSSQIQQLVKYYQSGPIVDMARALINPARDARVTNGVQVIRIYKTNASGEATSFINNKTTSPVAMYNVDSLNYGANGNNISFYVSPGSQSDIEPSVVSDSSPTFPLTITSSDTLAVNVNGTTYTMTLAGTASGTFSQAQTIALLNGAVTLGLTPTWTTLKPVIFAASGTTKITATLDPAVLTAYSAMFEYAVLTVDSGTLKTALNFISSSTVSSTTLVVTPGGAGPVRGVRGNRIISTFQNSQTETINENPNVIYFSIEYVGGVGSAATLTIATVGGIKTLTTTCTGDATNNLSIDLSKYTIKEMVSLISNNPAYECVTSYYNASVQSAALLDWYNAIDIKTMPLDLKGAQQEISSQVNNQSSLITLTPINDTYGALELVPSTTRRYLTGGSTGGSSNTDFQNGFDAMVSVRCNTVIPCISRDATADMADGITDPTSAYAISSVVAQLDAHLRLASNTRNKSERNGYAGYKGSFKDSINLAKSLNSEFTTLCIQDVDALDADGVIRTKQPHILCGMCAGIQSGTPVGEPITFKYINAYGLHQQDYDIKQDIDTALEAGICVVETPDAGGYRIVVGNTTYGKDGNFVFNRISVMDVANYVAYNLRQQLESAFIGTGRQGASSSATTVYNYTTSLLSSFTGNGVLVPTTDNGYRGYKNLTVTVNGNTINIDVTITPVQGIEFILATIMLDSIHDVVS